jgi:hypothetical protein
LHNLQVNGSTIKVAVKYGDYSQDLAKAVEALKEVRTE